jgi:hypothetical protein
MKFRSSCIPAILFFIGFGFLAFIAGATVTRYRLPAYQLLDNGFIAVDAWVKAWNDASRFPEVTAPKEELSRQDEEIITHPQVSWNKDAAHNGYTLITTGYLSTPLLVDMEGRIAYRWKIPTEEIWPKRGCNNFFREAIIFAARTHVFPNGNVVAQMADWGIPYGCGIVMVDKDSKILWSYKDDVHHDMVYDRQGNIYTLTLKVLGKPVAGYEKLRYPLTANYIVKLSPQGEVLDRISLLEAFKDTPFELYMYHGRQDGDDDWDWFHANSLSILDESMADRFPQFKPGSILISIRAIGTLAVIDPDTRKIVWAARGPWSHQHAASFQPTGTILLLDNLGHVEEGVKYSRVLEFNPVTMETTWYYAGNKENALRTTHIGRVQRLANGNTLVGLSESASVIEVTGAGEKVWSYQLKKRENPNPYADAIFNADRYTSEELPFLNEAAPQ